MSKFVKTGRMWPSRRTTGNIKNLKNISDHSFEINLNKFCQRNTFSGVTENKYIQDSFTAGW